MKSIASLLIALAIVGCNNHSTNHIEGNKKKLGYPEIIDSLGLKKQYDNTKWTLYCYHGDDTCKFWKETGIKDTTITFGMLDLKYEGYNKRSDTVELFFGFYYNDTMRCDERNCRAILFSGAAYKSGSEKYFALTGSNTLKYFWTGPNPKSRFYNPLQPEVLKYIKENKKKLNPWFYAEAKKRGVIE